MESIKRGEGRPRKRPKALYADTKYNMPLNLLYLDGKHIKPQIRSKPTKKRRPGRPRLFSKASYDRARSSVERSNGWIKAFRRIIIRYDRLPPVYMGFVHLACIIIYLRILQ